jgi:hypothetical protein
LAPLQTPLVHWQFEEQAEQFVTLAVVGAGQAHVPSQAYPPVLAQPQAPPPVIPAGAQRFPEYPE